MRSPGRKPRSISAAPWGRPRPAGRSPGGFWKADKPDTQACAGRAALAARALVDPRGKNLEYRYRPGIADAGLDALDQRGVRGVRLNLESGAGRDLAALNTQLETWARRIASHGWHLQVYAAFDVHQAMLDRYDALPVPVVLDHYAMAQPQHTADDPGMQRLLWASDWPHTNREPGKSPTEVSAYRDVPARILMGERESMFTDPANRQRVLVDNPQRLYRYDGVSRSADGAHGVLPPLPRQQ